MNRSTRALTLALLALGAACGRGNNKAADTSLNADLSLAAQQRGYMPLDSLSAAERAALAGGTVARRRTSTGGTSAGTTTPSGGETVVKHTKRDAAIGAAAGAIIGATTSKDKVKGGIIGAAVGGILGGVIGNNVDIKRKKP